MGALKKSKAAAKKAAQNAAARTPAAPEPAFDLQTAFSAAVDRMHAGSVKEAAATFAKCFIQVGVVGLVMDKHLECLM